MCKNRLTVKQHTRCRPSAFIRAKKIQIDDYVKIGRNVKINCDELIINRGAIILNNVTIENVKKVTIGAYAILGDSTIISGLPASSLEIGPLSWIGRSSFINVSSNISIGRGTCIGIKSNILTHGAWLEIAEGTKLNLNHVSIGSNVWLAFGVTVQPGATIHDNVFVHTASVVNGTLPSGFIYGGIPAKKLKNFSHFTHDINYQDKINIIASWLSERLVQAGWKGTVISENNLTYNTKYTYKRFSSNFHIYFSSHELSNSIQIHPNTVYFLPQIPNDFILTTSSINSLAIDIKKKTCVGSLSLEYLILPLLRDYIFRFYPHDI